MLYLHGMGHYHPENIITNAFIESLDIGSDEDWIMERVGIKERRTSLPLDYIRDTRNSDPREASDVCIIPRQKAGAKAARMAIERAKIQPEDIGMVISGGCTPGHQIPAEAAMVGAELNLEVPCIDIGSACSSFVVQLAFIGSMRPETLPSYILIVNNETFTHAVDYSDRKVAPLFGDGVSAAVVSLTVPSDTMFDSFNYASTPGSHEKVVIPHGGHFNQDGRAVQGYAIRKVTAALKTLKGQGEENNPGIRFIGHQANFLMLSHVCERCDIPTENHWYNVVDFGNTGCAGAPTVLSQNWENLQPGMDIAIVVVGAGLTWANTVLRVN